MLVSLRLKFIGTRIAQKYFSDNHLGCCRGKNHKLPAINSISDLKEALQKLGSIPPREIKAVEVLWTPQIENDAFESPR
ncbi:hypothetical protein GIB67_029028 [Kingdonia uniflora]|uniref:Uncharacterized protein n=1 Tax=Kingdonia uniflora TaxID=39325 RepID=A0A7J7N6A6_9MAGN|nr:hypothetical protein GIB67_029028 [Kingdonia uniflora]